MSVSFCHMGGEKMASYRYRCQMPAKELGASINDPMADILVLSKPVEQDLPWARRALAEGRKVIVDVCDVHFDLPHYVELVKMADAVVCPTEWFAEFLADDFGVEAWVIGDPYELEEAAPHCSGTSLLWFGHATNFGSLQRVLPHVAGYHLDVVSNIEGMTPWSHENLLAAMAKADIVVIPETAPYKSANRTIEALRRGCFVVSEPHPATNFFPGIWIGNIRKGIEWAQENPQLANKWTERGQSFIRDRYSPKTVASAWRKVIQKVASSCTLEPVASSGPVGCPLISTLSTQT